MNTEDHVQNLKETLVSSDYYDSENILQPNMDFNSMDDDDKLEETIDTFIQMSGVVLMNPSMLKNTYYVSFTTTMISSYFVTLLLIIIVLTTGKSNTTEEWNDGTWYFLIYTQYFWLLPAKLYHNEIARFLQTQNIYQFYRLNSIVYWNKSLIFSCFSTICLWIYFIRFTDYVESKYEWIGVFQCCLCLPELVAAVFALLCFQQLPQHFS